MKQNKSRKGSKASIRKARRALARNNNNKVMFEIKEIKKELKQKKSKTVNKNLGKRIQVKGIDFIRQVDVFPVQLLDGSAKDGIKLVAKYDISPTSFPNTRLELISNTYQLYRFTKVKVTYTSMLPTAVNGLFLAYIDTDPMDVPEANNSTDLLRIARSHQGSVQGKIRDNWSFTMPQRDDDQFYFIGQQGDKRFRKMGTLYVFQIGQATKFDGTPLTEELSAGALNIHWSCEFMNPQLQQLDRIYDGVSEKDILRVYQNLSWYRAITSVSNISNALHIAGTRFRQANFVLHKDLFTVQGVGDYVIVMQPLKLNLSNTVKQLNSFALPYSNGNYKIPGTDFFTALANGKLDVKKIDQFVKDAYKLVEGGIKIAKKVYDVIQVISPLFLATQVTGVDVHVDIEDPDDVDITHAHESLPVGALVVHYDGINSPLVQTLVEYLDIAHAADAATTFTYKCLFSAYKLNNSTSSSGGDVQISLNGKIVEPSLPYLPKLT
jgi:hypothetical protein